MVLFHLTHAKLLTATRGEDARNINPSASSEPVEAKESRPNPSVLSPSSKAPRDL